RTSWRSDPTSSPRPAPNRSAESCGPARPARMATRSTASGAELRDAFGTARQEVDQGAERSAEEHDQHPDQTILRFRALFRRGLDQHPDPERNPEENDADDHHFRDADRAEHQILISSSRAAAMTAFCAFLNSRAAAMNERNSGCGAAGRDLYSGWNWQPTNHGCPSSSMISTNLPSGEMPVTRKPFSSSAGTYSGLTS